MPIYLVSPGNRLVRANTYGQAVNYAAKAMFKAVPVKADDLADMLRDGAKIEDARAPVNQELPLSGGEVGTAPSNEGAGSSVAAAAPSTPFTGDNDVGVYSALPATGGPLEPERTAGQAMADAIMEASPFVRTLMESAPADDIDTVTLEGIDHVQ